MITVDQYFGKKPHTESDTKNALYLISRVNVLLIEAESAGVIKLLNDPDTGTLISGSKCGAGDGGFRLSDSATGRAKSSHKEAKGIDIYDPQGKLDAWLDSFEKPNGVNKKLEMYSLYREHASATKGWCHLQTRAPKSGRRTFYP